MDSIIKQLKEYIDKTPKDVLQAELEEYSKKYNHIGPTVDEYLQAVENSIKKQIKEYIDKTTKDVLQAE